MWKWSFEDLLAEISRRVATESLGSQSRVALDISGASPVLLDRWEFEAFSGTSKDAEYVRRAVVLRSLIHETRTAFEGRADLSPNDLEAVLAAAPPSLQPVDEVATLLTRLGEMGGGTQGRKYLLTRDNLLKEADALSSAFVGGGFPSPRPAPRAAPTAGAPGARARLSQNVSSMSGAFAASAADSRGRTGAAAVLLLVMFVVVYVMFRPAPDPRRALDPSAVASIAKLERLWLIDDAAGGVVPQSWYTQDEQTQEDVAVKIYDALKKDHQIKRLTLYQPAGRLLAAYVTENDVKLTRFIPDTGPVR